eukprot:CAMPEP_0171278904 /NCGR_PEP_ID=MMETSP0790-20130122/65111_1 /TAXON_ID=2925 /ORGANISM="Alexandrium catenella, Strain OF101" /LENGTH=142 /DNA_ID=CAMNT_0011748079 /DNA_START=171 /DNA_END=595 /DNA_ORIENTATION=-
MMGVSSKGPDTNSRTVSGYIKTFSPTSGWGFIICDEVEKDVFVHVKNFACSPPREHINSHHGQRWDVDFELDQGDSGKPKAFGVRIKDKQGTGRRSEDRDRPLPLLRGPRGSGSQHDDEAPGETDDDIRRALEELKRAVRGG